MALLCLSFCSMATKTTTTTTTTVYGKNNGTTVSGPTVTVNCDNFYSQECYKITTTTTTESMIIKQGDPITVTVYDENGRNPQVALEGNFDYVDETRNENRLTVTFAIQE